jgi:small subunit ribosomal protein S5
MIKVPLVNDTIPFAVQIKRGAAVVLLKPAKPGTGVIAGGAVRAVVEAAGVKNIVSKILGSNNQASNVYATFKALEQIQRIAEIKGVKLADKPTPQVPVAAAAKPAPKITHKPAPVKATQSPRAKANSK